VAELQRSPCGEHDRYAKRALVAFSSGTPQGYVLIMLSQAISDLLPLALGVALSPVPIIAVILMLGTPKARSNGPAFAIGWVLGLVVVSIIVLVVASGSSTANSGASNSVDTIKLVFGLLFIVMAAGQWRKRPKKGEEAVMPKWMASIDTFTAGKSFVLGAALSGANPKNLALTLAAAGSIAQAGLAGGQSAIAVAVFVIIGSLTVAGPVVFYMAASKTTSKPLAEIKDFMSDHNAVIMMVVLLILGAKLLGAGLAGLQN
jgi:threonine/homoserine/homoserine lactone efflux protein